MLPSRTRIRATYALKAIMFDAAHMQEVVATQRRHSLEDCMEFRGQWDERRRFQLVFLKEQGLKPEHTLLEIGCDPLADDGAPTIDFLEPTKYIRIDIRSSALDQAWGEVAAARLSSKWKQFPFRRQTVPEYAQAAASHHAPQPIKRIGICHPREERLNEMLVFSKSP